MTKVWIVNGAVDLGYHVFGVFSSLEKAVEVRDKQAAMLVEERGSYRDPGWLNSLWFIEEFEVDAEGETE